MKSNHNRLFLVAGLLALSLLLSACCESVKDMKTPTAQINEIEDADAALGSQNNVQCGKISVFIHPDLATGAQCANLPENISPEGMLADTYPAHDELTLTGYITGDKFHDPRIIVYPIQRYQELNPLNIIKVVTRMQAMIATGLSGSIMPFLPIFNAGQVFQAKIQRIETPTLSGFRYITLYSQWTPPINNNELFYTFQGITSHGQSWVTVILPRMHLSVPYTDTLPNSDAVAWVAEYEDYLAELVPELEMQEDDSFEPALILLDELVHSIVVAP